MCFVLYLLQNQVNENCQDCNNTGYRNGETSRDDLDNNDDEDTGNNNCVMEEVIVHNNNGHHNDSDDDDDNNNENNEDTYDNEEENNSNIHNIYNCPQQITASNSDIFSENDSYESEVPISAVSSSHYSSLLHLSHVSSVISVVCGESSSMVTGICEYGVSVKVK